MCGGIVHKNQPWARTQKMYYRVAKGYGEQTASKKGRSTRTTKRENSTQLRSAADLATVLRLRPRVKKWGELATGLLPALGYFELYEHEYMSTEVTLWANASASVDGSKLDRHAVAAKYLSATTVLVQGQTVCQCMLNSAHMYKRLPNGADPQSSFPQIYCMVTHRAEPEWHMADGRPALAVFGNAAKENNRGIAAHR